MDWTTRATSATAMGLPTTSAMKIVRRDQSISPIERLKTRHALVSNDSERAVVVVVVIASPDT